MNFRTNSNGWKNKIFFLMFIFSFSVMNCNTKKETPEDRARGRLNTMILLQLYGNYNYNQAGQDKDTAYAIDNISIYYYNLLVAGTSGTTVNRTTSCSGNGTLTLTGTASQSGSDTAINLVYSYANCTAPETSSFYSAFTQNGTYTRTGTFSSSNGKTTARNITGSASSLVYSGTLVNSSYFITPRFAVSGNCAVTINSLLNSTSGTLCGRSFSMNY